ncbi:MAG: peptidoglycan DD-metalloendopeptidase family protein [Acidobacteria bacterium]|nr:peptidoglycan DD-metalloendopeptidase family protein [Acidobacteriota bacterium]NIM60225.1 peptidoglycan DD-metalloendopeptidase family protein [Acidobacteriota bacterium]NIO60263.1 peptidoglycan DD-metalloendopeptidase family protein [Acidobacteriota bacterium]NIQ31318.1 peptidoglycan DD-metalloendopeptidase family protein [Acidobacteriota bacterium]NIQ86541.1 peptidoglycan DD-metalloendopeptidase family protein [Acidobacteriota bacterium]
MPELEPESELPPGVFHRVRPGQTLWRIARTYGVELESLVEANSILDPSRIVTGDMIWIPGARDTVEVGVHVPEGAAAAGEWIWPVRNGVVLSGFGAPRRSHRHGGLDIKGFAGQPVVAARSGRVVYAGAGLRGYGKTVILDHSDGIRSLYAHNSALLVRVGERVDQGQSIARIGRTGNATTEHCHFEIRVNDRRVDPSRWLSPARRAAR